MEMVRKWISHPFWHLFHFGGGTTNSLPILKRLNLDGNYEFVRGRAVAEVEKEVGSGRRYCRFGKARWGTTDGRQRVGQVYR